MSKRMIGVAQELGRSCRFHGRRSRTEVPGYQLQARVVALAARERKYECDHVVSLSKGNEVTRDGRQEVIVS